MNQPAVLFEYRGLPRHRPIGPVSRALSQFGATVIHRHQMGERGRSNVFVQYPDNQVPAASKKLLKKHGLQFKQQVTWTSDEQRKGTTTVHVSLECNRSLLAPEMKQVAYNLCTYLGQWGPTFACVCTGTGIDISCNGLPAAMLCNNARPFIDGLKVQLPCGTKVYAHSLQVGLKPHIYSSKHTRKVQRDNSGRFNVTIPTNPTSTAVPVLLLSASSVQQSNAAGRYVHDPYSFTTSARQC
ncbi:hypothetical protein DIPPA_63703 [Diplonema papillatum]|nr:hypothetical protein DIPPA_63703 [Diplonema papillatum]